MKNGKAVGPSEIVSEMVKAAGNYCRLKSRNQILKRAERIPEK